MIIYEDTIEDFIKQCQDKTIGGIVAKNLLEKSGEKVNESNFRSYECSLPFMADILNNQIFDKDINVAIEYKLSVTKGRIDFVVYGKDDYGHDNVVIIELKQWSTVRDSNKQDYVFTRGGDGEKDYRHPSYQAYSYLANLVNFNEYVRNNDINLKACSYLHNMPDAYDFILENFDKYPLVKNAPAFLKEDSSKLRDFIAKYVKKSNRRLLYYIDNGKISPSKELAKTLDDAIKGKPFYGCDDNQDMAIATIVEETVSAVKNGTRSTIIIKGGPGTGKSVVAINALGQLINNTICGKRINAAYFTQNAAPRKAFTEDLIDFDYRKSSIEGLFKSPLALTRSGELDYDCVLIDEAHRVYDWKGGTGVKKGVNTLEKIITSSLVNVFFIDEDQAVTRNDYATIDKIKVFAKKYKSKIIENDDLVLTSQFRCCGGEDYISFVKGLLGYPNYNAHKYCSHNYDVQVFDDVQKMHNAIKIENAKYGKCRLVAGYTHNWGSKNDSNMFDFVYGDYKLQWNKNIDSSYINDPNSINEVGCIHTIQGLDLQYCGVIIGKDMKYRNGKIIFDKSANARTDNTSGIRNAEDDLAVKLIRNTYNVLLTRGMRGTFIYCEDEALREYIKSLIS